MWMKTRRRAEGFAVKARFATQMARVKSFQAKARWARRSKGGAPVLSSIFLITLVCYACWGAKIPGGWGRLLSSMSLTQRVYMGCMVVFNLFCCWLTLKHTLSRSNSPGQWLALADEASATALQRREREILELAVGQAKRLGRGKSRL